MSLCSRPCCHLSLSGCVYPLRGKATRWACPAVRTFYVDHVPLVGLTSFFSAFFSFSLLLPKKILWHFRQPSSVVLPVHHPSVARSCAADARTLVVARASASGTAFAIDAFASMRPRTANTAFCPQAIPPPAFPARTGCEVSSLLPIVPTPPRTIRPRTRARWYAGRILSSISSLAPLPPANPALSPPCPPSAPSGLRPPASPSHTLSNPPY